ncbi:hypothetical protein Q4595_25965, partial [Wenyingzhuangia sp. 1_MG-2023]|nr:hypothetical protein [Wenyingzhuangia sp. 1_MG-2023]
FRVNQFVAAHNAIISCRRSYYYYTTPVRNRPYLCSVHGVAGGVAGGVWLRSAVLASDDGRNPADFFPNQGSLSTLVDTADDP